MSVTITLSGDLVDALHHAVGMIDVDLGGWYPSALDPLVQAMIAADPRSVIFPRGGHA